MKNKVFLGGTCANTTWREELIDNLKVDYFNPVVNDWTPECIVEENKQKEIHCNIHLYVITSKMKGVYSIAEVIDSVESYDKITILHVIPDGFDDDQLKSLNAVVEMVRMKGGIAYVDSELTRTVNVLNYSFGKDGE